MGLIQSFLTQRQHPSNSPPTSVEDNFDIQNFQTCVLKIFDESEQNMSLSRIRSTRNVWTVHCGEWIFWFSSSEHILNQFRQSSINQCTVGTFLKYINSFDFKKKECLGPQTTWSSGLKLSSVCDQESSRINSYEIGSSDISTHTVDNFIGLFTELIQVRSFMCIDSFNVVFRTLASKRMHFDNWQLGFSLELNFQSILREHQQIFIFCCYLYELIKVKQTMKMGDKFG